MPAATTVASAHVELLTAFANTLDVDDGTDSLGTPSQLAGWLREHDLVARRTSATDEELALARILREGIRAAMTAHHDNLPVESVALTQATSQLPLQLNCCGDRPGLEPVEGGVRGGLAHLLVAVNEAMMTKAWGRVKICADDSCQWAFYDATKNRSKSWCCDGCGNKAKTRTYRQRKKSG